MKIEPYVVADQDHNCSMISLAIVKVEHSTSKIDSLSNLVDDDENSSNDNGRNKNFKCLLSIENPRSESVTCKRENMTDANDNDNDTCLTVDKCWTLLSYSIIFWNP